MPRGRSAPLGTETVNANGYTQVKTEEGWIGKHNLILEKKLGRKMLPGERAIFKDNDRSNLDPDNIILSEGHKKKSIAARIAKYQAEILDRQEWIRELEKEL
jgi:hypothetical protein